MTISIVIMALASAAAGSVVPGAGNIVGFVAGLFLGTSVALVDYFAPQVRQGIKDFVYDTTSTIVKAATNFINEIGNFFDNIGNTIMSWFW